MYISWTSVTTDKYTNWLSRDTDTLLLESSAHTSSNSYSEKTLPYEPYK